MIRLERLNVVFGTTRALADLDLELGPGITGLFGPNGSGKSTLLRVLAGLLRPSSGRVHLLDVPFTSRNEELRRTIGYAGHESGLYGRLTVKENLQLFARLYGVGSALVDNAIESVGLQERAAARVETLSAGFKRRAAVARALLHEPRVLLLDEPYANLDDDAAQMVSAAIVGWRRPDRVCLIATHGAKKVKAYADGGVILQRGRLVVAGRYSEQGFVRDAT